MLRRETVIAFEGRFQGVGSDSAFFAMYDDAGVLGGGLLVVLWGYLLVIGAWALYINRNVKTTYSFAFVIYAISIGMVMRYQVYPVWVFMGVMLIPCVVLWRSIFPVDNVFFLGAPRRWSVRLR